MVGLLLVVPCDELYYGIIAEISSLQEIRVKLSESTVEIALRTDVRQATLNAPMLVEQTRAEAYGLLVRIVRACAEVETYVRFVPIFSVSILMVAPKAPVPLVEVPTPR